MDSLWSFMACVMRATPLRCGDEFVAYGRRTALRVEARSAA